MNILVSGGAGFIGANFVHWWRAQHPTDAIFVLYALTYAAVPDDIAGAGAELIPGDIVDTAFVRTILRTRGIEKVVNFAAESHNRRANVDPAAFFRTNVLGTQPLLKPCRLHAGTPTPHLSTS